MVKAYGYSSRGRSTVLNAFDRSIKTGSSLHFSVMSNNNNIEKESRGICNGAVFLQSQTAESSEQSSHEEKKSKLFT